MPKQLTGTESHPGKQGNGPIVPTPEDVVRVRELAAAGKSMKVIACRLGISIALLETWMKRHKEVRLEWEAGMAQHEESLQSVLEETIADPKAKMRVPAAMFMLKVKHKWHERSEMVVVEQKKATTKVEVEEIAPPAGRE